MQSLMVVALNLAVVQGPVASMPADLTRLLTVVLDDEGLPLPAMRRRYPRPSVSGPDLGDVAGGTRGAARAVEVLPGVKRSATVGSALERLRVQQRLQNERRSAQETPVARRSSQRRRPHSSPALVFAPLPSRAKATFGAKARGLNLRPLPRPSVVDVPAKRPDRAHE